MKDKKSLYVYFFLEYAFLVEQRNSLQVCFGSADVGGIRRNIVCEVNPAKKSGKIGLSSRKHKSSNLQAGYTFGKYCVLYISAIFQVCYKKFDSAAVMAEKMVLA